MSDELDHDELLEQAETVRSATEATMYYPVAHGEAKRLQYLIEDYCGIESSEQRDWSIEGTAHVCGLGELPDKILDMHTTEQYAVFSDGETLLLKPAEEVEP